MAQYPSGNITVPSKLVTKVGSTGETSYTAVGAAGTPSSTAFGAWFQVVGSTASDILITGILFDGLGSAYDLRDFPLKVDVGTGGAGSETVISSHLVTRGWSGAWPNVYPQEVVIPVAPVHVASGTRVAVRTARSSNVGPVLYGPNVGIRYVPYSNIEGN